MCGNLSQLSSTDFWTCFSFSYKRWAFLIYFSLLEKGGESHGWLFVVVSVFLFGFRFGVYFGFLGCLLVWGFFLFVFRKSFLRFSFQFVSCTSKF